MDRKTFTGLKVGEAILLTPLVFKKPPSLPFEDWSPISIYCIKETCWINVQHINFPGDYFLFIFDFQRLVDCFLNFNQPSQPENESFAN